MKKLATLIFLLLGSCNIQAEVGSDWNLIGSDNQFNYYYRPEGSSHVNGINQEMGWFKAVVIKDIAKDGLSIGDEKWYNLSFDCNNYSYALLEKTRSINGNFETEIGIGTRPRMMNQVVPGSMIETMYEVRCADR